MTVLLIRDMNSTYRVQVNCAVIMFGLVVTELGDIPLEFVTFLEEVFTLNPNDLKIPQQ